MRCDGWVATAVVWDTLRQLGWPRRVTFEYGPAQTIEWHRNQRGLVASLEGGEGLGRRAWPPEGSTRWSVPPDDKKGGVLVSADEPHVDVVSVYGTVNAGVRARAMEWLERSQMQGRLTSYFDLNRAGASFFLRHPAKALAAERRIARLARTRPRTLLLSREASPLSNGRSEDRLLSAAQHGVYDIDDALHQVTQRFPLDPLLSKRMKADRAARCADVVIAGNEYLAEWASGANKDVRIIPTCVDPSAYSRKSSFELGPTPQIVWLGTPSGEPYLVDIAPALLALRERVGARLTIIGSGSASLGSLDVMIERVPWSLEYVRSRLRSFDVGIMPLRDGDYERGKCAYKLLEYGAAALPSVASPVGANAPILQKAAAPAPRTVDDWYQALAGLLTAPATERAQIGQRLHEVVAAGYSFAEHESVWLSAVMP